MRIQFAQEGSFFFKQPLKVTESCFLDVGYRNLTP